MIPTTLLQINEYEDFLTLQQVKLDCGTNPFINLKGNGKNYKRDLGLKFSRIGNNSNKQLCHVRISFYFDENAPTDN